MIRRLLTVAVALSLIAWIGPAGAERLHPRLEQQLRALPADGKVSVIVEMMSTGDPQAAATAAGNAVSLMALKSAWPTRPRSQPNRPREVDAQTS